MFIFNPLIVHGKVKSPYLTSLNNNLLSYYTFNNTLVDSKGNYNLTSGVGSTATIYSSYSTGKQSKAAFFSGTYWLARSSTNGSVVIPLGSTYPNFSISVWAMVTSVSGWRGICGRVGNVGAITTRSTTGELGIYRSGFYGFGYIMPTNVWRHLVFVYNGSWKLYVNGVLYSSGIATNITFDLAAIGAWVNGTSGNNPWHGSLDEFGIWSRALLQEEITQLYNSGNGITYTDFA